MEFAVEEIPPPGPPGIGPDRCRWPGWTRASPGRDNGPPARPPRIVVYRRPLTARADSEDELGELIFEVVVEEFARLLGVDPEDVDPGYAGD